MLLAFTLWLAGLGEGLRLDWQAPAECPDVAAMRGRVVWMIGEQAVAGADVQATARVTAEGGRWKLELELVGGGGRDRRTLVDAECQALADAAALVIAVAIDPLARAPVAEAVVPAPPVMAEEPVEAGPPIVEEPPVLEVKMPEPLPAETPVEPVLGDRSLTGTPRDRRTYFNVRAGVGVGFAGLLPGPHAALELAAGAEGRGWRVELGGVFAPPVRGTAASDPTIGGVFRLGAGEVRGCGVPRLRSAPVYFPLCAGLQVGAMHGRGEGTGLVDRYSARALWVAGRVGGAVRWRIPRTPVGLMLGLDVIVPVVRPDFITAQQVRVHQAAPVGGQATFSVELWIPRARARAGPSSR